MSVYFFYRCPYQAPAGSYLKRFDDDSVLDWFRARWQRLSDTNDHVVLERVAQELGCNVYSFFDVFAEVAKQNWPVPTTAQELGDCVESAVYNNHVLCPSPHLLQVDTDNDDVGLAYYFFDDHYLARHGKRAAFLLRGDWRLPAGCGPGRFRVTEKTLRLKHRGRGEGTTFVVQLDHVPDMEDLVDGFRIDGVRLPGLMQHLAGLTPDPRRGESDEPLLLPRALLAVAPPGADPLERAFLQEIRERPREGGTWDAYSDWLQERGELPAGLHTLKRALTWASRWYDAEQAGRVKGSEAILEDLDSAARCAEPWVAAIEGSNEPSHSLVQVQEHVAQLCLHFRHWRTAWRERHIYHEWIYFDDLWASAHPDLANSILRYVRRWDVLSTSRSRVDDDT
ncbi:MAG: hypothetical protein L0Z62_33990 [Gemmataceae bacterium]|nr:hypothetical protein [Gemmataceae bacterium]